MNPLASLVREVQIFYYHWAQHDLQHKDPTHPDLNYVVLRLRHLLNARHARPCALRRTLEWL